ncbi:hypothetical protein HPB49_012347 [Dermacentor silvarum]|uniref:Uncharacterized protein n=1 Tax=Dermacentor silvarum TaxID=543639 RepID=A0ACB8DNX5_DERSI|nr:hypothetical protein HPB49_012347 [Dermacentor silvarum]
MPHDPQRLQTGGKELRQRKDWHNGGTHSVPTGRPRQEDSNQVVLGARRSGLGEECQAQRNGTRPSSRTNLPRPRQRPPAVVQRQRQDDLL